MPFQHTVSYKIKKKYTSEECENKLVMIDILDKKRWELSSATGKEDKWYYTDTVNYIPAVYQEINACLVDVNEMKRITCSSKGQIRPIWLMILWVHGL